MRFTRKITHPLSRRTFLRGVGVTMALPWLESLPVWGDDKPKHASSEPPVRFACLFSGNGFHSKEWWAKGEGAEMELGKVLESLQPVPREDAVPPRAVQPGSPHRRHPQLPDRQPAHRRPPGPRRRDQVRRQLRSGHRRADEGPDQGAEPGAGLRAVDRGDPQELLDDLQLAHLVEFADHADAAGTVPGPGVRPPVPRRGRPGRQERARRRHAKTRAGCANKVSKADQRRLDEYLSSVREVEQRIEQAGKAGRLQGWRPTLDQARHAAPGRRHPAGHRPAHAAHVRHPRAGLPHRHHARLHAEAEQRPLVAALPAPEGGLHDPPPAVAHRRRRLAEGEPVLHRSRWPTSPEKLDAGAGRRPDAARQLR